MGPGFIGVVSATISTATVSVAVGVVVLAANPSPVSSTTAAPPAAVATHAATTGATSLVFDAKKLASGIAALAADVLVVAAQPDPTPAPALFDTKAMYAGLAGGGYSFTMQIDGFSPLTELGTTVRGTAVDSTHYTLEFPLSTVLKRYARTGDTALATLSGGDFAVAPGQTSIGDLSPEDLTPAHVWAAIVEPWVATLKPTGASGVYAAVPLELILAAQHDGYAAKEWVLTTTVDASRRLTALTFKGVASGVPFTLEISITYS